MERVDKIMNQFQTPNLLVRRDFVSGGKCGVLLFCPDLSDSKTISTMLFALTKCDEIDSADMMIEKVLFASEAESLSDINEICYRIMNGDCAVIVDGIDGVILANTRFWTSRAIAEPPTESVIAGPREGFTEDFKTNLSLIERRLRSRFLAVEKVRLGRLSGTNVAICYLSNVAKKSVVSEVKRRLSEIDVDAIYDTHNLEPYLEYHPLSLFKQVGYSERPDEIASKMSEGRVAIIVDGSPMILTVPYLLLEDIQSPEDYYQRSTFATFLRFLRLCSIFLAVMLPGVYVTIQVFNYDIVPIRFLVTIMNAVKASPTPPLAEMLLVIILFEIMREASVRMPRVVGTALSIVGAIVLGETAVNAGILSSPSILISAISSIALFTVPNQLGATTLLRLIYTIIGGILGLYGMMIMSVFLVHYLAGLDSYGTPYLAPFAPIVENDYKDSIVKKPFSEQVERPQSLSAHNKTRQKNI